ncbi:hypothetical protein BU23DRAFT_631893 [Bimuria novae-zelandiae CBS 107.79]|uniref:Uncharacterized protein n=1 Tax=Bimuria novae-zelandiae CBS 107.79 TaxID=1447943 RepID=A0A6A5UHK2_9PLEO|nr:hypothetical protein BU23DRAFT_631893 [Bimuria novae-zelandiae CBS 107.79]
MKVKDNKIHFVKVRHFPIHLIIKVLIFDILLPVGVPMDTARVERSDGEIGDLVCKSGLPVGGFAHLDASSKEQSYTVANIHLVKRATVYKGWVSFRFSCHVCR